MSIRIHILEIVFSFDVEKFGGGIDRFVIDLCRSLDPDRFKVTICALGNSGTNLEEKWLHQLNQEGIPAFAATQWEQDKPYQSFFHSYRGIARWLENNSVDIIHSHSEFSDIVAILYKLSFKPQKILRTVHYGYQIEWRKRPLRRCLLTYFLYPLLLNKEVGVSQAITGNLNNRFISRLLRRNALCIYNAVDLNRFDMINVNTQQMKQSLGIPIDSLIIGSVGRLTEQKGYKYLVDAAALLIKEYPNTYFILVGDGELSQTLQDKARSRGISSHFIFTGPRSDVEKLLATMDLFVSSSLWEGLPTVIMESMAAGTPVVATDIPGTQELIIENHSGWLAPSADPSSLCSTMLQALNSPHLRKEYAINAKRWVQKFSMKTIANQYQDLYSSIQPSVHIHRL